MSSLRRHLRLWVATWLVFQAVSLSALVPRDCCAAHRPAARSKEHSCHKTAAATHCPMHADGRHAVPDAPGRSRHAPPRNPATRCSMRGTCDGPMAALFALLSNYGVLTDSFAMSPDLHASPAALHTRENLISRLASPDPPPPRA